MDKLFPYQNFPPPAYLKDVCNVCPKASALFIDLWELSDANGKIYVDLDDIRTLFLTSKQGFNHNLNLLVKQKLVSVERSKTGLIIELTQWDYDENTLSP